MTATAVPSVAETDKHMAPVDWVRLAIPGLVWGTSFYFIAQGLNAFPAALITPMRVGFGCVTLGLFPAARRARIDRSAGVTRPRWRQAQRLSARPTRAMPGGPKGTTLIAPGYLSPR